MNIPIRSTDMQYVVMNHQDPLEAILFVMNAMAQRLTKDVWATAYVHMNVNSRKEKVELPNEVLRIFDIGSSGTRASPAMHRRLGQSMLVVSQRMSTPAKIPRTCMPEAVIPAGAGTSLKNSTNSSDIMYMAFFFIFKISLCISLYQFSWSFGYCKF